jgi:hypothetical protein
VHLHSAPHAHCVCVHSQRPHRVGLAFSATSAYARVMRGNPGGVVAGRRKMSGHVPDVVARTALAERSA